MASVWLDTVLSGRGNQPDPVAPDPSPLSKRPRLQPPTPDSPREATEDGIPVTSGLQRPTQRLSETRERPQTSHSNGREQTARRGSSPPPIALSGRDDEPEMSDETSATGSKDGDWYGVEECELDKLDPLPPSLDSLLKQIRQFSDGIGILPTSDRRYFNKLDDKDTKWARQGHKSSKFYSKERQTFGQILPPEELRKIVSKRSECDVIRDPDSKMASLDMGVNSRVLDLAFEQSDGSLTRSNSLWM